VREAKREEGKRDVLAPGKARVEGAEEAEDSLDPNDPLGMGEWGGKGDDVWYGGGDHSSEQDEEKRQEIYDLEARSAHAPSLPSARAAASPLLRDRGAPPGKRETCVRPPRAALALILTPARPPPEPGGGGDARRDKHIRETKQ